MYGFFFLLIVAQSPFLVSKLISYLCFEKESEKVESDIDAVIFSTNCERQGTSFINKQQHYESIHNFHT